MITKIKRTLKRWKDEKVAYKANKDRIKSLNEDYKGVMHKAEDYLWRFSKDGSMFDELCHILELLEEGMSLNKPVEEVIGQDVYDFCDGILSEIPEKTWMQDYKKNSQKKSNMK